MLSQYIKAGYVPQCGCNKAAALEYVENQYGLSVRFADDNCTIEVDVIGTGAWTPSGYYWENEHLFSRR